MRYHCTVPRIHYEHPPIIEAVCEFLFSPAGGWDNAMPGIMYGILSKQFPHRSPARRLQFHATAGDQSAANVRVDEYVRLGHAQAKDQIFVQLAAHHVSVHYLAPYVSWAEYRPLIDQALLAYREVAQPAALRRVGQRYVNRLAKFPSEDFRQALNVFPEIGADLPQALDSFSLVVTAAAPGMPDGGKDTLKLAVKSDDGSEDRGVFLDIDCSNETQPPAVGPETMSWVDAAHECVTRTFDRSLGRLMHERLGRREVSD